MSITTPNLRENLSNGVVQQLGDLAQVYKLGDLLGHLVRGTTATEAAAAVASNAKTLTAAASAVWDVIVTAGGSTGRKRLLIGDSSITPIAGEVVWDGASGIRFAAADAVTAASFWYARQDGTNVETSLGNRRLGQRDPV